jgi:hypothetical protein
MVCQAEFIAVPVNDPWYSLVFPVRLSLMRVSILFQHTPQFLYGSLEGPI